MMSLRDSLIGAIESLHEVAGVAIVYERGNTSLGLVAIPGSTEVEQAAEDGVAIRSQARDYLIATEHLGLGPPQRGDRIHEQFDGQTYTYEVLPLGDELWRFTDQYRTQYRIHTRLVNVETQE